MCSAVNTPKKLLFEAIGEEFDSFVDPNPSKFICAIYSLNNVLDLLLSLCLPQSHVSL